MVHEKKILKELTDEERGHSVTYSNRTFTESVPKYELPKHSLPSQVAYQICHDELNLDGNPALNLASFVSTWMEPEARQLIAETLDKNLVDEDEYPQTKELERRCVSMLARLFHSPEQERAVGTSTIGSSEAIMLAGLSHKWRWKAKRCKEGLAANRPNIVMSADVQIAWDKFARYFEVEPRILPMHPDRFTLSASELLAAVDENTIGVVCVLGTTFTGEFDPIKEVDHSLSKLNKERGLDIPIHVDAASGGFVAPFVFPNMKWDFRLPCVKSINVSGHKYGLVYPGIGWVLWRDRSALPEELVFTVNYLGGDMPNFNLNFSRSGSPVVAQYYNFLRLGREGYTRIMQNLMQVKHFLHDRLKSSGLFTPLTSRDNSLPLVTARLSETHPFTVFQISEVLRERGWIVPAYTLPPNAQETAVLRIVVRESFSRDMAENLLSDMERAVAKLSSQMGRFKKRGAPSRQTGRPC